MIRRFKTWLYNKFLPRETKDLYLSDMQKLLAANAAQKEEIKRMQAYIDGLQYALRNGVRVTIKNNEVVR